MISICTISEIMRMFGKSITSITCSSALLLSLFCSYIFFSCSYISYPSFIHLIVTTLPVLLPVILAFSLCYFSLLCLYLFQMFLHFIPLFHTLCSYTHTRCPSCCLVPYKLSLLARQIAKFLMVSNS